MSFRGFYIQVGYGYVDDFCRMPKTPWVKIGKIGEWGFLVTVWGIAPVLGRHM